MGLGYLVLLAVVQGLTEFLPVSSSAHLILLPRLLEHVDQGLRFDVAANTGTFIAVLAYFRREIAAMTVAPSLGDQPRSRRALPSGAWHGWSRSAACRSWSAASSSAIWSRRSAAIRC